jgi:DinB superfamily
MFGSSCSSRFVRRWLLVGLALITLVARPVPAHAQDAISKEGAAAVKAAFLADLETMRGKFVGLAQAFPAEKYTWRPMEGVRSVSEVFMLLAFEGYSFAPGAFGAKAADLGPREEANKLRTLSDKTAVIEHLNKGFAHAKTQIEAVDPATLTTKRKMMGRELSVVEAAMFVGGDMHEHLGQLIAYARMNQIVPPWSK